MLTVDSIQFAYKGISVLDGLDLSVAEGDMVGVVGPNGAGKTTLVRLISGVLRPSGGRVLMHGTDLESLTTSRRARLISVVPQNPELPLGFTVLELVLMGRNPHLGLLKWESRSDLEVATRAMDLTGTLHLADRTLDTVSGGERQRAVVAMALAQEAPFLLLDEPTSNLDLAHQTRVMDIVRESQSRRGGATLLAMHDLTLAAQYCSRIVMLSGGRSYAEGSPGAVLTRENICSVYGAEVAVLSHPKTGTPVVLPVSKED